jgi:hypothetical protein
MPDIVQLSLLSREIPLTQGLVAIVDADLYAAFASYRWCVKRSVNSYAARWGGMVNGKPFYLRMHREVLRLRGIDIPAGHDVHHINGNPLDNRSDNLAVLSRSRHVRTYPLRSDNKSGYRGVSWCQRRRRWRAVVKIEGKSHHVGLFKTPEEAAAAVEIALQRHGLAAIEAPLPAFSAGASALPRPALQINNTSGYRGVWRRRRSGKWEAHLQVAGNDHYLGAYDTPEEAASAYAAEATRLGLSIEQ